MSGGGSSLTGLGEQVLRYSSSSVQGRRPYNEDRCQVCHPLLGCQLKDRSTSYFAVFDGHGGEDAAEWTSKHLHDFIAQQPECNNSNNNNNNSNTHRHNSECESESESGG